MFGVVRLVGGLGLSFSDQREVLCLLGLDFVGVFWDSVVDGWVVVGRGLVVSWGRCVVSGVSSISDLSLGFGDEGKMVGLGVLNFGSVDWDSVHWCWCWLVSPMVVVSWGVVVVGWSMLINGGLSVVSRVTSITDLSLGFSDESEMVGLGVLNFSGINWDSVHWCWGVFVD